MQHFLTLFIKAVGTNLSQIVIILQGLVNYKCNSEKCKLISKFLKSIAIFANIIETNARRPTIHYGMSHMVTAHSDISRIGCHGSHRGHAVSIIFLIIALPILNRKLIYLLLLLFSEAFKNHYKTNKR